MPAIPGDAMYLIQQGRVRITVTDADGREVVLSELHEGEFFGEMALIDGHERSAGATVLEDTRLAILTREDFISFLTHDHKVMLGMLAEDWRGASAGPIICCVTRGAKCEHGRGRANDGADRAADLIATFGGSWKFIGLFLVLLVIWIGVNIWFLSTRAFDPYPFVFLNLGPRHGHESTGADHHDVAESPVTKRPPARRPRLRGEPEE